MMVFKPLYFLAAFSVMCLSWYFVSLDLNLIDNYTSADRLLFLILTAMCAIIGYIPSPRDEIYKYQDKLVIEALKHQLKSELAEVTKTKTKSEGVKPPKDD